MAGRSLLLKASSLTGMSSFPSRWSVPEAVADVVVRDIAVCLLAALIVQLVQALECLQEVVRFQRVAPSAQGRGLLPLQKHFLDSWITQKLVATGRSQLLVLLTTAVPEGGNAALYMRQWLELIEREDLRLRVLEPPLWCVVFLCRTPYLQV